MAHVPHDRLLVVHKLQRCLLEALLRELGVGGAEAVLVAAALEMRGLERGGL